MMKKTVVEVVEVVVMEVMDLIDALEVSCLEMHRIS